MAILPLESRTGAVVAVRPAVRHGVTIWGGEAADGTLLTDGSRIDARAPADVQPIPPAPIAGRRLYAWAADGRNLYVWGGVDQDGSALSDGAQFEGSAPGTGWTMLPQASLPGGPASATLVNDELFVVGTDPATGEPVMSSIRVPLEEGRGWRPLSAVPLASGEQYDIVGCCDEERHWLFVFSRASGRATTAAALDLVAGGWTEVGAVTVPALPAGALVHGRAIEDDLVAWLGPDERDSEAAVLLSLRHPEEPWVVAPVPAGSPPHEPGPLVLGPSHLIDLASQRAFDLVAGRWQEIPGPSGAHDQGPSWSETDQAWWDRGRLWWLDHAGGPGATLWTFTPRPPEGTFPLPSGRRPSAFEPEPCVLYGRQGSWRLRGDPDDPRLVWLQKGKQRVYLDWPDGWHVRFEPQLVITDSSGAVRYRGGQRCPAVMGTGG